MITLPTWQVSLIFSAGILIGAIGIFIVCYQYFCGMLEQRELEHRKQLETMSANVTLWKGPRPGDD